MDDDDDIEDGNKGGLDGQHGRIDDGPVEGP